MKSGYVSIIGKPNTGKSTLLNNILKQKISPVTYKAQTTRNRILGIYMDDESQIIFYDTPGLLKAKNTMEEYMVKDINISIKDGDIIVLMVDNINYNEDLTYLLDKNKKNILIINKIDKMPQEKTNTIIEYYKNNEKIEKIIPISAKENVNIDILISTIKEYLPYDHLFYPEDVLTDKTERFFVSELVREQLFLLYGAEIPYSSGIIVEEFKEREKGKLYIKVFVYIERDSQKGILIGERGKKIKDLGIRARRNIEDFLGKPVYIEIHIKVKKHWKDNILILNKMWNDK